MIHLNICIGEGAAEVIKFFTLESLSDYLKYLKDFDSIWLATEDGEKGELLITESVDLLCESVKNGFFCLLFDSPCNFYVQEYKSFESAYAVALDMKEANPKCYD